VGGSCKVSCKLRTASQLSIQIDDGLRDESGQCPQLAVSSYGVQLDLHPAQCGSQTELGRAARAVSEQGRLQAPSCTPTGAAISGTLTVSEVLRYCGHMAEGGEADFGAEQCTVDGECCGDVA